ncbi:MAG: hypothetical protein ONB55_22480 [candidate division KSB1 bacterium]|nr:hypothetical protein [candidate division KSB1 bacterium]
MPAPALSTVAGIATKAAIAKTTLSGFCGSGDQILGGIKDAAQSIGATGDKVKTLAKQIADRKYGNVPQTAYEAVSSAAQATDSLINTVNIARALVQAISSGKIAKGAVPQPKPVKVSAYVTKAGKQVQQYFRTKGGRTAVKLAKSVLIQISDK